jgi:pilus assembly protein CpaB
VNLRRVAAAFFLALLISGTLTFWLSKRITQPRSAAIIATRKVVVAARSLHPGDMLTAESVQTVNWPVAQSPAGVFGSMQDVTGRAVLVPLAVGEPILPHQLALMGAGAGLMGRIPVGMRALSVRVDEASAASGFAEPGSTVDILAVYKVEDAKTYKSSVVLQNVTILAVGQRVETDPDNKHPGEDTVTVLVTPEEATRLSLAGSIGKLQFVLRNGTDQTLVAGLGDDFVSDFTPTSHVHAELHATGVTHQTAEVAKVNGGYQVETFAGAALTKQTFQEDRP